MLLWNAASAYHLRTSLSQPTESHYQAMACKCPRISSLTLDIELMIVRSSAVHFHNGITRIIGLVGPTEEYLALLRRWEAEADGYGIRDPYPLGYDQVVEYPTLLWGEGSCRLCNMPTSPAGFPRKHHRPRSASRPSFYASNSNSSDLSVGTEIFQYVILACLYRYG